jgi:1-acyl-sn-glycerol-3-phosphate acyltransferase
MEYFIQQDEYHTPEGKRQSLLRRIHFPITLSFYLHILRIVLASWYYARKGKFDDPSFCQQSRMVIEAVESNGGIVHIWGLDNIRKTEGPVVFISNHMSTLETFVFPCLIQPIRDHAYVVKENLLTYPIFGAIMQSQRPIAVTRKNPREDLKTVLQKGVEFLKAGRSLVIFPQSTRTTRIDLRQFNTLGLKLAQKAGVPIIPIAVKTDYWGAGKVIRDFGLIGKSREVYIRFGEPILIQGNGRKEHQEVVRFITSHLKQWSRL